MREKMDSLQRAFNASYDFTASHGRKNFPTSPTIAPSRRAGSRRPSYPRAGKNAFGRQVFTADSVYDHERFSLHFFLVLHFSFCSAQQRRNLHRHDVFAASVC